MTALRYVIVKNMVSGAVRNVEEGADLRLQPDEKVVGSSVRQQANDELIALSKESGVPVGDLIAKATKAFGIKPCSKCEKRRIILNKMKELGFQETIKKLKETI